jgi:DNA-binding NarL/FixJ family response regulator
MKISLIVADSHHLVREGMVAVLAREPDMAVVAQARDGLELMRLAKEHDPKVLVIDLLMPNMTGLEAMRRLRAESLSAKMLCLSAHGETGEVVAAIEAGAKGVLIKQNSGEELIHAVRRLHANMPYYSSELMSAVRHQSTKATSHPRSRVDCLTSRERQITQLISEGHSTQEVADRLFLSTKTVASHRENVFKKLQLRNVVELTRFALSEGLSRLDRGDAGVNPL